MKDSKFDFQPTFHSHYDNGSVALIVNPKEEILFIERSRRPSDPWSGHMSFPGGRADDQEEPIETAIRETYEETGLMLKVDDFIGHLPSIQGRKNRVLLDFYIHPHVFVIENEFESFVPCEKEVAGIYWIPLSEFGDEQLVWKSFGGKELPCFPFRDNHIWGLSFAFLCQFLIQLKIRQQLPLEVEKTKYLDDVESYLLVTEKKK